MSGKRWMLRVIIIMTAAVMFLTIPSHIQAKPEGVLKQAIHWSISADWLDPATAGFSIFAHLPVYLFHDALVKAMPQGFYAPSIAESWNVSPDAKVYEFRLRQGVKFHNGDAVTAEDVVFSFWRYKAAQAKAIHSRTEKVEAVNPYLVRIRFKDSFPDFMEYFIVGGSSLAWIAPKNYIEKVGDAGFKKNPVGCGPYKFVEFIPGVRLVGEAFEQYWRKVPNIRRMEFHTVSEPGTRLAMVKRGEADIATLMQGVFYQDAKKSPNLRLLSSLSPTRHIVYFTTQWDPRSPWSDPRVRLAASLAIDRQTLADVHSPGGAPVGSIGTEGDPMAVNFPAHPYDPAQARKLLAEAGYPNGFHGGKYYPFQGGYWAHGEQIANYWKAVGISVDTVLLDRPALSALREGRKMAGHVFIESSISPTIGGRLSWLLGAGSYGSYPDIQALWLEYNKAIDPKVRKDLIGRIQKLIYDKVLWIPLTTVNSPAACGLRVKGDPYKIQPTIWFTAPFEDVELEK